tara:strand:+ start:547 stop:876 length:330 start_codon:yes stop_codon:yes gene_type:complete
MPKAPKGYFTVLEFMTMSDLERDRELRAYADMIRGVVEFGNDPVGVIEDTKKKVRRKKSAYQKRLGQEMKRIRQAATTKRGQLRKGVTPSSILKKAHRATKKAMGRRRF